MDIEKVDECIRQHGYVPILTEFNCEEEYEVGDLTLKIEVFNSLVSNSNVVEQIWFVRSTPIYDDSVYRFLNVDDKPVLSDCIAHHIGSMIINGLFKKVK